MSTLRVANVVFDSAATNRIDYVGGDNIVRVTSGAIKVPVGITSARPSGETGLIRYNSETVTFEGHNGSGWGAIGGAIDLTPANNWANNIGVVANAFAAATIAGANAAVGLAANTYANLVWARSNTFTLTFANSVGVSANAFASATIAGANTRSDTIGTSANAFASATIAGANTRSDTIGTSANAFASATISGANTAVGLGANSYANVVWARSNTFTLTFANSVGVSANAFASATIAGANTAVGAGANSYANVVWARSNTFTLTFANSVGVSANAWANTLSPIGQQTIWIPANAMVPRITNGPTFGISETATNRVMIKTLDFDTATQEFAQFAIQMPKGWNEGTIISQFVWSHPTTATNFGVVWQIQGVAFADNNASDTAFGSVVSVADAGATANNIYISNEAPAMTVAGAPTAEEYVVFQVSRETANASDTLAVDARLHGIKLHYTIDAAKDD